MLLLEKDVIKDHPGVNVRKLTPIKLGGRRLYETAQVLAAKKGEKADTGRYYVLRDLAEASGYTRQHVFGLVGDGTVCSPTTVLEGAAFGNNLQVWNEKDYQRALVDLEAHKNEPKDLGGRPVNPATDDLITEDKGRFYVTHSRGLSGHERSYSYRSDAVKLAKEILEGPAFDANTRLIVTVGRQRHQAVAIEPVYLCNLSVLVHLLPSREPVLVDPKLVTPASEA